MSSKFWFIIDSFFVLRSGSQDGDILVNARDNNPLYLSNSSSKLASLFGQDRASFSGGNESLTYTPPKQPKKEKAGKIKWGKINGLDFYKHIMSRVHEIFR